jgi:hypothetical protein
MDGVVPFAMDFNDIEILNGIEHACVVLADVHDEDGGKALGEFVVPAFPEDLGGFEVHDARREFALLETPVVC